MSTRYHHYHPSPIRPW